MQNETNWQKTALILIFLVNIVLAFYPTIFISNPVSQFDGGYYYTIAKTWQESGINAEVPRHAQSSIKKVSDYPPFVPFMILILLKLKVPEQFIYNGGFAAVFLLIGNFYFFLLVEKLTKSRNTAIIALALSVLSLRTYYQLYGGIWPFLVASALSIGALYHFISYNDAKEGKKDKKQEKKHLSYCIALSVIVFLTNSFPGVFMLILMGAYLVAKAVQQEQKEENKNIKRKVDKPGSETKGIEEIVYVGGYIGDAENKLLKDNRIKLLGFLGVIFIGLTLQYALVDSKESWFLEWKNSLISGAPQGYPPIWRYFMIIDNPLLVIMAVIGVLYLLRTKQFETASLTLGGVAIILLNYLIVPKGIWLGHFFLNFYLTFYYLICISAAVALVAWSREGRLWKPYLACTLAIGLLMTAAFAAITQPAITDEELYAAKNFAKIDAGKTFFVTNIDEQGFRSTNWVFVFADPKDYDFGTSIPEDISNYNIVFIFDRTKLSEKEISAMGEIQPIYEGNKVLVAKVK